MRFLASLICMLSFISCQTSTVVPPTKTTSLQNIIERYEQSLKLSKDAWINLSDVKLERQKVQFERLLTDLNALPETNLSTSDQINRDVIQLSLEDQLFHLEFQSHLFPLDAEGGFLTEILYRLQYYRIASESDYQHYLLLLQNLPTYLGQRATQMQRGQALGKSSPKLIVQNCMDIIEQLLAQKTDNLFFLQPVVGNAKREAEVTTLLKQDVLPAYRDFYQFLKEDYLPKAPEAVGISGITDGAEFYEQRVRHFTTLNLTPEEVFETGQREVKRIRAEMETIIADLNFEGSFADFIEFLRTDSQFYAETPKELLKEAAWITKRMEGKLPQYFNTLPRMPLTVTPVPASIAPTYTAGRYSSGSYAQNKAGQYWVNTYKLSSRPLYALPALSLHEGVPGHHTQIMLAAEMNDIPDFRRNTYFSAFGEGWALYTEYLGKEAGIYETPYEDFGRLVYEMWRACRLVVDPGMHYFGWTRERAFNFMAENTALSLHEVNTEIDRYIGWPGQAVSYKIGELKIKELRHRAETELGDQFDIRAFHDFVLSNGAIPLMTLERLFEEWLMKKQR